MRLFGITQLINAVLYILVKIGLLDGNINATLYIVSLICWFLGALSLNRAWEQKKISHKIFMILSHASLFFVASIPY